MKKINAGQFYAYAGAIGGFALSFWANVRDAYIPEIPKGVAGDLWRAGYPGYHDVDPNHFDLVLAGFFPVALFVALELLTRVAWKPTNQHKALKWLGVGGLTLIAGIISYSHLRTGFLLAGWSNGMASLAPLAVDGFMLLCTTVLLMTGHAKLAHTDLSTPAQVTHHSNPSTPAQVMVPNPAQWGAQVAEQAALSTPGQAERAPLPSQHGEQPARYGTAGQSPSTSAERVSEISNVEGAQDADVRRPSTPAQPKPRAARKPAQKTRSGQVSSDPEQVARAAAAVSSGELSQSKAAEKFGVSRAAIQRWIKATETETEPTVQTPTAAELERMFAGSETEKPNED